MNSKEIPSAVLEKNMILSGLLIPLNKDEPKTSDVPLNVAPLRMIPIPYGGNEAIPFSEQALARLKKKDRIRSKRKEVDIPLWLKSCNDYVEGDWKAFRHMRSDGRRTDPIYIHKVYPKQLRSKNDVKLYMEAIKTPNPMFRGSKLQTKETNGSEGHNSGRMADNGTGRINASW